MYTFRRLIFAIVAIVALVGATPAFAQNGTAPAPRFSMKPLFSVTPTTPTSQPPQQKQQGLGIFVQGGYVYQTIYTGGTSFESKPQGFIAGIGLAETRAAPSVWVSTSTTSGPLTPIPSWTARSHST
jgi:hypothetical protein